MSDLTINVDRVLDLTEGACDEIASLDDLEELDTILLADQRSRDHYLEYYRMHVTLRLQLRARRAAQKAHQQINIESAVVASGDSGVESGETPSFMPIAFLSNTTPTTVGYFSSDWLVAYSIATVIFAIGAVIGSFTYVSHYTHTQVAQESTPDRTSHPQSLIPNPSPKTPLVARITGMVDCQWATPSRLPASGHVAMGQRFTLASGLMEITYDTGAEVILQGPVTYEVQSRNSGFLSLGKLTGKVEVEKAKGFIVRVPTAVITDLGTEFGVEVDKAGVALSHVFRGSVRLETIATKDGTPAESRILYANESARVAKTGDHGSLTVQPMTVDPAAFVRSGDLPKLAEGERLNPFRRWQKYNKQLRKDPSLLAYYDFQLEPGFPSLLPNVAANGGKSLDGIVENATWTTGRMPGKHALLFGGPNDRVRVNLNRKLDNLTLVMWVCAYSLDDVLTGLLMSDGWDTPEQMHWQLTSEGRISFGLASGGCTAEGSIPILDRLHRWIQFAAVYDGTAGKVRVYMDGTLVDNAESLSHQPVCIGPAQIGCWDSTRFGTPGPTRNFHGRIDELVIFSRALGDDEVKRMYEEGRAANDRDDARSSQ